MISSPDDIFGTSQYNAISEAGFDYIELSMATVMSADEKCFRNFMKKLSDSPIKCEIACSLMQPGIRVVDDEYNENKLIEYIEAVAKRASEIGIKTIVFGSPLSRSMTQPPYSLANTLLKLEISLHIIMDYMDAHGITVVMEPLNRLETNVINTFSESADFCRRVGRKSLRSMIDFAHFKINYEPYDSIIANSALLAHIHISRPFQRKFPTDEREEDYSGFIKTLSEAGYDGTMSIEAVSGDVKKDAKTSYKMLRELISRYYR